LNALALRIQMDLLYQLLSLDEKVCEALTELHLAVENRSDLLHCHFTYYKSFIDYPETELVIS
jgi:hypothetical protein